MNASASEIIQLSSPALVAAAAAFGLLLACGGSADANPGAPNGGRAGSGAPNAEAGSPEVAGAGEGGRGTGEGGRGTSDGGAAPGSAGSGENPSGSGQIGIVGEGCSPPGKLACAGNYQKLTVVCGGDGVWEANETCDSGQFCNSAPGPDAGLCATPPRECTDKMPGARFCRERSVVQCGPDAVTVEELEQCERECMDGTCVDMLCDPNVLVNCTTDCGGPTANCHDLCSGDLQESALPPLISPTDVEVGTTYLVRLPLVPDDHCACSHVAPDYGATALRLAPSGAGLGWRVEVAEPWQVTMRSRLPNQAPGSACADSFGTHLSCVESPLTYVESDIWLSTDRRSEQSATATVRLAPPDENQCP